MLHGCVPVIIQVGSARVEAWHGPGSYGAVKGFKFPFPF